MDVKIVLMQRLAEGVNMTMHFIRINVSQGVLKECIMPPLESVKVIDGK